MMGAVSAQKSLQGSETEMRGVAGRYEFYKKGTEKDELSGKTWATAGTVTITTVTIIGTMTTIAAAGGNGHPNLTREESHRPLPFCREVGTICTNQILLTQLPNLG